MDEHRSIGWSDVAAAVVVAPDLWSAHASARWTEYLSLVDMQLLVDYTGGYTPAMSAEVFSCRSLPWVEPLHSFQEPVGAVVTMLFPRPPNGAP